MRDVVEDKDIDIQYIQIEDDPADIITKNTLEAYFAKTHEKDNRERTLGDLR